VEGNEHQPREHVFALRERIDCAADRLTGPALAQMLEDAADAGDIPTTST